MTVQTMTVVDFQWNDNVNPESETYKEVIRLWKYYHFGNDNYYYKWDWEIDEESWPLIATYLRGLPQDNPFLIHWWW